METILYFQKEVYYRYKEGFSEVADEHKCSVAGLAALWDEDSSSGAGGLVGMQVGVVRSQCICPGDYYPHVHTYTALG